MEVWYKEIEVVGSSLSSATVMLKIVWIDE